LELLLQPSFDLLLEPFGAIGVEQHVAAGEQSLHILVAQRLERRLEFGALDRPLAQIDAPQECGIARHLDLPFGWMVSPRFSISTNSAIFLARPASVFILCVRNPRAKRFCALSLRNISSALGSASIAASRSAGNWSWVKPP